MSVEDPEGALCLSTVWWDGSAETVRRRRAAVEALGLSGPYGEEGSDFWSRFPDAATVADLERAASAVAAGAPREWALRRLGARVG